MIPAPFEYRSPQSVEEALDLLVKHREEARILSGGHSLIPALRERSVSPGVIVDLRRIPGLAAIEPLEEGGLRIGARATHRDVERSGAVQVRAGLLAQTASQIGDPQVRSFGTLVGSICQADPASDYPAALLALEALVVISSPRGERSVPIDDFLQGLHETALEPDELVVAVEIPRNAPRSAAYVKVRQSTSGFAAAGVAVLLRIDGGVVTDSAIGVTGASERAFLARELSSRIAGRAPTPEGAAEAARGLCDGLDVLDAPGVPPDYRAHLVDVCARRAILAAASKG